MRRTVRAAAAAVVLACWTLLLTAGPALADDPLGPREGAEPEPPLDPVVVALLYVVLPVGLFLLVAALVWLPGAVKANRYRPNRPWLAAPVWFAGPADPHGALASASAGDDARGGSGGSW